MKKFIFVLLIMVCCLQVNVYAEDFIYSDSNSGNYVLSISKGKFLLPEKESDTTKVSSTSTSVKTSVVTTSSTTRGVVTVTTEKTKVNTTVVKPEKTEVNTTKVKPEEETTTAVGTNFDLPDEEPEDKKTINYMIVCALVGAIIFVGLSLVLFKKK